MSIAFRPNSVLPIASLGLSCFLAGVLLAGATVSHFAESKASAAERQSAAVRARITLLESVLRRQADSAGSFSAVPADGAKKTDESATTAPTDVPVAANPATTAQAATAARAAALKKDRVAKLAGSPSPAPEVAAAVPRPSPVARAAPAAPEPLPKPVSAEALAAAKATNRIEGISAEKIGVSKIEASGVVMRNGSRIPVGGRFPSNERLLAVDPATGQIITDARTVLVFVD